MELEALIFSGLNQKQYMELAKVKRYFQGILYTVPSTSFLAYVAEPFTPGELDIAVQPYIQCIL